MTWAQSERCIHTFLLLQRHRGQIWRPAPLPPGWRARSPGLLIHHSQLVAEAPDYPAWPLQAQPQCLLTQGYTMYQSGKGGILSEGTHGNIVSSPWQRLSAQAPLLAVPRYLRSHAREPTSMSKEERELQCQWYQLRLMRHRKEVTLP